MESVPQQARRKTGPKPAPVGERFARHHTVNEQTGCWLVKRTGWGSNRAYGTFNYMGKNIYAHRASWLIHRGPIPEGMCICHRCDTPACVNPDHLFLGTRLDNQRDMVAKGRGRKRMNKTHCVNGHEFAPQPVRHNRKGARVCVECDRISARNWYRQNKSIAARQKQGAI